MKGLSGKMVLVTGGGGAIGGAGRAAKIGTVDAVLAGARVDGGDEAHAANSATVAAARGWRARGGRNRTMDSPLRRQAQARRI